MDVAVVEEEAVGQATESADGLGVVARDRLIGEVAGGHHERGQALGEEVLERGGREHDPEKVAARCDRFGEHPARPLPNHHDRPLGSGQQPRLLLVDDCHPAGGFEIGRHHSQRLCRPVLPRSDEGHGCGVCGVAGQMEAAEALDGEDAPSREDPAGRRDSRGS